MGILAGPAGSEEAVQVAGDAALLRDLLPDMGVTVDEAKLKEYAEAGVKRLLSFQTSAGGLAYWPGSDEPHAFMLDDTPDNPE